jgi:hypothetical protein
MAEPRFGYKHHPIDDFGQCHVFETESRRAHEVVAWCEGKFGPCGDYARWTSNHCGNTFWIREEADAFEFRIRWG